MVTCGLYAQSTHGNEFLGAGRMQGDGGVEVGFGCAHLNGDREALRDLIHAQTDAVQTDDFLLWATHTSFISVAWRWAVTAVYMAANEEVYTLTLSSPLLAGLWLGQADGADGWVAEHHGRYKL